jgi:hypothetical protein
MKVRIQCMRVGIALMSILMLAALVPGVTHAVDYSLKNFVVLVDDQLIIKGAANINCCQGVAIGARSDIGSRNKIILGGTGSTDVPPGAPVLQDVAVIAPNVTLNSFAAVSMVIYDKTTGSYTVSGSSITPPLPANLYNDLGNNPLNTSGDKSLPDFPAFPAVITPGASDITVPNNGTANVAPGSYRDLLIGSNATVNFTASGTYTFRRIIANTASAYQIVMLANDIQINVADFVRLAEYGQFNQTFKKDVTLYIAGFDGPYAGANKNHNGVTRSAGAFPAAFEYMGDGGFDACFVFVKNGTMNLRGHSHQFYATQWFGNSLQEISNLRIDLQHPGEICFTLPGIQCACIDDFKLNKTTGILTVSGQNFSTKTVAKLAVFSTAAAVSGVQNLSGGDLGKDQVVTTLNLLNAQTFTTQNNMSTTLGTGTYYLGIIYPVDPNTGLRGGYCIFTDKALAIP